MLANAVKTQVVIQSDSDVVTARQKVRELAASLGFAGADLVLIATAVSELARNILEYAGRGEVSMEPVQHDRKRGISVAARDDGPGIADIELALQDGYSTGKSLGLGLPGAKRLMDEFDIVSVIDKGTTVTVKKWLR